MLSLLLAVLLTLTSCLTAAESDLERLIRNNVTGAGNQSRSQDEFCVPLGSINYAISRKYPIC